MDYIAGAKILQQRFRSTSFRPDKVVLHGDRRATFIRMSDGAAIIRRWGESRAVAVPPETLSTPVVARRHLGAPPASAA